MDGTAVAGADYVGVSGTLRIAPRDTAGVISVPILEDDGIEGEETFTLTLSGVQNAVLGSATSLSMIVDNESVASLWTNGMAVGEDAGFAVSSVTPSGQSAADELHIAEPMSTGMLLESSGDCKALTHRDYLYGFYEGESCRGAIFCTRTDGTPAPRNYHLILAFEGSTATSGEDFILPNPSRVLIQRGNMSSQPVVVDFEILQDDLVEGNEEFKAYCQVEGSEVRQSRSRLLIRDDDRGLVVDPTQLDVDEGDDDGDDFTVHLQTQPTSDVTVVISGHAGTDVRLSNATLIFTPENWETDQTVTVTAIQDEDDEDDAVTLTVSASGGGFNPALNYANVYIRVFDDGYTQPVLELYRRSGKEGLGWLRIFVGLSKVGREDVTVDFKVNTEAGDTATEGDDYTSIDDGSMTIPAGDSEGFIIVTLVNDFEDEDDETFSFTVTAASNADLPDDVTATQTILDDDNSLYLVVREGDDKGEDITLKPPWEPTSDVTVTVTGHAGTDLRLSSETLIFTPENWEVDQKVTVTAVHDDDAVDDKESLTLTASGGGFAGTILGAVVKVLDDDTADLEVVVDEGDAKGEDISLSMPWKPTFDVTVTLTGHAGTDVRLSSETLIFTLENWNEFQAVTVTAVHDDDAIDDEETLTMTASGGGFEITTMVVVTIIDDDEAVTLRIADTQPVSESAGEAVFEVTLSGQFASEVTVTYATEDVTARVGSDYSEASGTLTFTPGMTKLPIAVAITDDDFDEEDETFRMVLSDPVAAGLEQAVGTATIIDDDDAPTVSIEDAPSVTEGEDAMFAVKLSVASGQEVTVPYATSDATATAGQDYEAVGGSLVIPAGKTDTTIVVETIDDPLSEETETFMLTLQDPGGADLAVGAAVGTGTILDNDEAPTVSIEDAPSVTEGVDAVFAVKLSVASGQEVTVPYATSDATATAGQDYEAVGSSLVIPAGKTDTTIVVETIDDPLSEETETFMLTLQDPGGADLAVGAAVGTGTILDNDEAPTVSIEDAPSVTEGVDAVFAVKLSVASGQEVTVRYATSDATATAGQDYEAVGGSLVIPAGKTDTTIVVGTTDDVLSEETETFTLTLQDPVGADLAVGAAVGTGTILDNDGAPTVSIEDAPSVTEGVDAVFAVKLSVASGQEVTVRYATSDATATARQDYEAAVGGSLIIPAGKTDTTIVVGTSDDVLSEETETFTLTLQDPVGADLAVGAAVGTGTILDNDEAPTVSIEDAPSVTEGVDAVFAVKLSEASGREVTVPYATSDATATAGQDYEAAVGGSLVIPAGKTDTTIVVGTSDDVLSEETETFVLTLHDPVGADLAVGAAVGTGTILDNDEAPTVSIEDAPSVTEGVDAVFAVKLSVASGREVTVRYATEDVTARAGSDYSEASGTLTFTPGITELPIAVAITDDGFDEEDETFRMVLSDPVAAELEQAVGTATIIDDDDAATLVVSGASVFEHQGEAVVSVRLTSASEAEVRVHVATEDGTAAAGADYAATGMELIFGPGDTEESVRIAILEDDLIEEDETFQVQLSGAQNTEIATDAASVTIRDNDKRSDLSIEDAVVPENAGTATVRVRLDPARSTRVSVDWATADGTATAGTDYGAGSGVVTFAPDQTEQTITVTVLNDAVDEDSETFAVRLSNASGDARVARSTATVTILDDEGEASLTATDAATKEDANAAIVRVALSRVSNEAVTVRYATSDGTATAGEDYVADMGRLTIPAGASEERIEIRILNDLQVEVIEAFTVSLTDPVGADISRGVATVTITDDDLPVLSIDDVVVVEDDARAEFTASLNVASIRPVTVQYASFDGTATAIEDYHPTSGELVIAPGQLSGQVEVIVIEDALVEDDETFTLVLSSPTGAALGDATGEATIQDNDTYRMSVDDVTVEEGGGEARFTVSLDRANPAQTVRVSYATRDGSATAGADYLARMGTLEIMPGVVSRTIGVPITDDAEQEGSETFRLMLSSAENAEIQDAEGLCTIVDDEAVNLRIADVRAQENAGQMVFVVRLGAASTVAVSTAYETRAGSATEGVDYRHAAGRLRFEPGETQKTITVDLVDDILDEPDETFTVSLSSAENAEYALPEATGTIIDDDGAPVLAVVSEVRVGEGDGSAAFAVTLSNPGSLEVRATYATMNGTAMARQDYEAATGTLRIAPGETKGTITVPILEDNVKEEDETFTLALSGAQNASLGSATGTGTIVDNDAVPTLSIGDIAMQESAASAAFTVTLSEQSTMAVRVEYATEDETATSGADYIETTGTLRITPGETAGTITVPILADDLDEEDETFVVKLSGAEHAEITDGTGRGTITDHDEPVTISIHDGRAPEDAGVLHLPVRLSRKSSRVVSVFFESSDISAEAGRDYTSSRGIVVFESGSTEGVVTITVLEDELDEEAEETFQVMLLQPTNAAIVRAAATGTIVDNDGMPLLRIGDITASEDGGEAVFTVSLSVPSMRMVSATYRTFDGTAQAGTDYVMASGTLTFAPGEVEEEVRVRLIRDERDWREETFSLALESAWNATLEDAIATATIVEEASIEEGVLAAHLARFARTASGHVVEAMAERLRWLDIDPACRPVSGESLQAMRYANPNWDPSAAELLSGCGLAASSGAFSVWGRGAFTRVSGKEGALSLSADVTTAALGADYRWKSGLMAGLLLAHSQASGTFEAYAAEGKTGSMLTGVYPYVSYHLPSDNIWALAGLGRGSMEVDGAERVEADLGSSLVAAGATGTLASGHRARLSYEADAFLARVEAEEKISVSRLRAGLEGSVVLSRSIHPYLEAALRRDGRDAETGLGLEVGGGLRVARPGGRFRAEMSSRGLVTHAAEGLAEWGVAAALRYGEPQGRGLTAEIRPVWGPAQSGGKQALWRHDSVVDAAISPPGQKRLEVLFGYGILLAKETGVAKPVLAVALRERSRDYRLGYEVRMQNGLAFSASGTARETANPWQTVAYGIRARATLRW